MSEGWCSYGGPPIVIFGCGGGCIHQQMTKVLKAQKVPQVQRWQHCQAMIKALGFDRAIELHDWNDNVATWDMVKERVKDAIGKL